jgi:hypothetical protein
MRTLSRLIGAFVAIAVATTTLAAGPSVRIGTNFTGSTYQIDSSVSPPDTVGAVGQRHIVELLNDWYAVYLKKDGTRVQSTRLYLFWEAAGVTVRGFPGDSRVVFDPFSGRWYASSGSFNSGVGPDDLLFAVSKTSDPTQGWAGFSMPFASPIPDFPFIDFPTLGFDRDGVFVFSNGTVLVVPKSDLLATPPSFARASFVTSRDLLTPASTKIQPIVSLDNTPMPEPLLGLWSGDSSLFRRWNIAGTATAPVLDASDGFIAVTPRQDLGNQGALQPESGVTISTSSPYFASSIVMRNSVMWGVQTIGNAGRAALRWFAIDANTNTLLQEGLIADPVKDVYMGSIAVNACNDVVIGFNESSTNQYVSSYAVAGTTVHNVTTFGDPLLLKSGVARFDLTFGSPTARWGDYSATVVDPRHPLRFWTFQEWPSAPDVWSTQITELRLHKGGRASNAKAEAEEEDDGDDARANDHARQASRCRAG